MFVRGSVDVVTGTEVSGWAYASGRSGPVSVQVVLDHEILGEAVANIRRPDLAMAGLGDGRCGYTVKLYREINALYLPFLSVKLEGGDAELPRSNACGFQEYFSALHRAYPISGRSRSVFGGLWTDRIDASAVLRGKLDIGLVPAEAAEPITGLIHEGVAIIHSPDTSAPGFSTGTMTERIGALLNDASVLGVLRAVLEDHPLVVQAATMGGEATEFMQPSHDNPSPSPAECLAVVVPLRDEVVIERVRESHKLPEFTPGGQSRWARGAAPAVLEMAARHGVIDRTPVGLGSFAVIAPGSFYRLRSALESYAMQMLCLPARLTPLALATDESRQETVCINGTRIWI